MLVVPLSSAGSKNVNAIVSMTLFTQLWYWNLLAHCTCSAFVHTAIICVTVWYYPAKSFPLSIRDAWPSLTSTCALFTKISTKVLWLASVLCWPRVLLMLVDEMLGLLSCAGSKNMNAIVSMTLFTQFWYWCH